MIFCAVAFSVFGQETGGTWDVGRLRALSAEEAGKGAAVELVGVVLFHDARWGDLFVADAKGAIYVGSSEVTKRAVAWATGTQVRVWGHAGSGGFMPVVWADAVDVLGTAPIPAPRRIESLEAFLLPSLDAQWVEVEAVVKRFQFENEGWTMVVEFGGRRFNGLLPRHLVLESPPPELIEQRVRVRGLAGTQFNNQRQMTGRTLFVPDLSCVVPVASKRAEGEAVRRAVTDLMRPGAALGELVRVRGVVTHAEPERGFFLRSEGGSMRVDSALMHDLRPGMEVEATGYVTLAAFRPALNARELRKIADGPAPLPVVLNAGAGERNSAEQCELVTVTADFIEMLRPRSGEVTLLCRAEGVTFESVLRLRKGEAFELEPGSSVVLTGICLIEEGSPFGLPMRETGFNLILRSLEDVRVVSRPPYWNNSRLLWLLMAVGGAGLLIGGWAYTLRRRVARQAELIERHTVERVTLEERQRIARELHDTLEQELLGVSMLLDTTSTQMKTGSAPAEATLDLARVLLAHSREESRSTIRDLRSVTLEQLGLASALEEMLHQLAESAGMGFEFVMEGERRPLGGVAESAMLRIGHEAVANAARHSGGKRVRLRLSYAARDEVILEVSDDGHGIGDALEKPGHFGINGMKERAMKAKMKLTIESGPERGTCVKLIVPTPIP
jgi:signal transduction histidine kinase